MDTLSITLGNVHCQSCANSIKEVISSMFKVNEDLSEMHTNITDADTPNQADLPKVSLLLVDDNLVLVSSRGTLCEKEKAIITSLEDAGFNVISSDLETDEPQTHRFWNPFYKAIHKTKNKVEEGKRHKAHFEYCSFCQENQEKFLQESSKRSIFKKVFTSSSSGSDQDTIVESENESYELVVGERMEYRAVLAVSGMSTPEDEATIQNAIQEVFSDLKILQSDESVSVLADSNTVVLIIPNKQIINTIISRVRNLGSNLTLIELLPIERSKKFKVTAAIGGMTCAACSSAVNYLVSELPFVVESAVNAVSKSGMFILDSNLKQDLDKLKETIEDVGYEFELVEVSEINHATKKVSSRSVNLKIDGMHCEHCPEEINSFLSKFGESVIINDPITLLHPFVRFTYVPSPPDLTIREVLKGIDELSPKFSVQIIKPVTLEEHLKKIAYKETMKVLKRLILSTVIAVPTFIIGIVCMSLLPKHHSLRMWLMKPMWVGNVSRAVWLLFILSTPVYIFADDIFHIKAVKEIRKLWTAHVPWKRRFFKFGSMSLLMCLGTTVAYFASLALLILSAVAEQESEGYSTTYFDSVVFLTFFLLIGRLLEAFSKSKTADAVRRLGDLKSNTAHFVEKLSDSNQQLEYGNDKEISLEMLEVGDCIRVALGESPAADAIIVKGESQFDESALTGESVPVNHSAGEQIFAGTVNIGTTSVVCKISALDGNSLIDQIVGAVRDGQMKRAPIERTADSLTGVFVPIICLLAVITWIIWLGLGYGNKLPASYLDIDIGGWCVWSMEFSIAVFVVACPCGIGLAAPTALFVGSGLAAKFGILARGGGAAFQEGARVNVVCFDKTGTLTLGGNPKVTDFAILNSKGDLIVEKMSFQIARDMELSSRHPLAIAVKNFALDYCQNSGIKMSRNCVPGVEEISGKGLKGSVLLDEKDGEDWTKYRPESALLGNEKLLSDNGALELSPEQKNVLSDWKEQGKSVILVAVKCSSLFGNTNYVPVLMMAARDQIRPEAKSVIALLQKQNISCWMISGDNHVTANAIAKQLGISEVVAEVLPHEKALKIEWIQKTFYSSKSERKYKRAIVAMVGDGINDAPALAAADVGVALASGSDLALTSSDFVLLAPKFPLISLLNLFSLSKAVFRRIRFNFGWAIVYNAIGIPISAGVIYPYHNSRLNPVWASAAMAASSISVVLSSLALRFFKPPAVIVADTSLEDQEPQEVIC